MLNLVWALALQEDGGGAGGGIAAVLGIVFMLVGLAFGALFIATGWKIFTKAGEPGWASLIPIYNFIVLLKIAGMPWWWIILAPIAMFIIPFKLANNFGKGAGFAVGLLILGVIFYPMLAFGAAQYRPQR